MFYSVFFVVAHSFFSLHLRRISMDYLWVHWFFPQPCQKNSQRLFISVTVFAIPSIFFWFLRIFISLPYIAHLFLHVVCFFYIKVLTILIIATLNSLSENFNIYVISEFGSDGYIIYAISVFPLKLAVLYQLIGTEVTKTLMWGFVLIWPEVVFCLMFVVAIGTKGFKFL